MKATMFNVSNGDRPGVPNIGIVITDGMSTNGLRTKMAAESARGDGIILFAVGIGLHPNSAELEAIATKPGYVFTVGDFSKLDQIVELFQEKICKGE